MVYILLHNHDNLEHLMNMQQAGGVYSTLGWSDFCERKKLDTCHVVPNYFVGSPQKCYFLTWRRNFDSFLKIGKNKNEHFCILRQRGMYSLFFESKKLSETHFFSFVHFAHFWGSKIKYFNFFWRVFLDANFVKKIIFKVPLTFWK